MKAAWYERKGPAHEVLQVGEAPRPAPGPGEVLVRVRASGVNPSDTKGRGGARGNLAMPFPRVIPHQDGAGVIEAVGDGVPASRVGERVWLYEAQLGRPFGTAAQYTVVPAMNAVPLPDRVSFEEGACLGVPALTAHRAVFADGPVEGQTVLVTGAGGAVGFYAVQFAKLGGARVIATVSRPEQAEAARRAGADEVIDRKAEDVAARIADLTDAADGRGVDRIVEVAFGANLDTTLKVLKPRGVVATYSSDADPEPTVPFWSLLALDATIRFVLVYVMSRQAHEAAIAAVGEALAAGKLAHNVGARFGLDEIAAAHEAVESGRTVGKVVVTVD
jgi:NADPH2:quinone reductase